jgi:plasmid stabilization system protein ParE
MMQVEVAESFEVRFSFIADFMRNQDPESGQAKAERLEDELLSFIDIVKLHPDIGRPATALYARSVEGQRRLARMLQRAQKAEYSDIREYVLRRHVVLYAHSNIKIVLLSIRHQRELSYAPEED